MTAHLPRLSPLVAYGVGDWPPCRDMEQLAAQDPELARRVAVARGIEQEAEQREPPQ